LVLVPREVEEHGGSGCAEYVCVIHDRHKGILQAINDMKEGNTERYIAPSWPDVESKWCVMHMKANFHSQLKNKTLAKLFERLCE
jgi:hypothetical protein